MKTLIHNARLLDPASDLDTPGGVLIEGDTIADIGPHLDASSVTAIETIDANQNCLAPGLIDLRVKTGEPGEEQRETLATASRAAVAGGVTSMVVMPDTNPVIDDIALVQFILNQGRETALNRVYPAGALTRGLKGEAMAEIGLMAEAGAVFFTNGDIPLDDAAIQRRTLSYAASQSALVASRPDVRALRGSGVMNAGALAARMGLKGIPADAELIGLTRDLILAESTGATLLVDQISTAKGIAALSEAKARGIKAYGTVAAHHLFFNELDVGDYLTYCKTNPPFRAEDDRLALIAALAAGEIDAIVSAHDPQPPEDKRLPFSEASFGAAGLETTLSVLLNLVQDGVLSLLDALAPVTSRPAGILGLPQGRISKGSPADIILFDPDKPWLCDRENLLSRSTNSPFDGRRMVGRALQTWVAGESVFKR